MSSANSYSQQVHGYSHGHQLLAGDIKLSTEDQDTVDRLSDISGSLTPSERFAPYLTTYPLPSRSHYVVARTWQDLDAPRAGCVLTRSIFVPMKTWGELKSLRTLMSEIPPVDRTQPLAEAHGDLTSPSLPPVQDKRGVELVEALFLEARQPILMFEAQEAELISERLLTAFWAALRRNFSICTMALSPRSLGGRPFDLLFAPKSARARFSDWKGRRVEANSAAPPRHRWTSLTFQEIFSAPYPSLSALDSVGALGADSRGDESALRLSLLWNELQEKSFTSPTAVLGMMDILNSRGDISPVESQNLAPIIARSISIASSGDDVKAGWTFFGSLLGKFSQQRMPFGLVREIVASAGRLAATNPSEALSFLRAQEVANKVVPRILCSGIGTGLTNPVDDTIVTTQISDFPDDAFLRLLASSDDFVKFSLANDEATRTNRIKRLIAALSVPDSFLVDRARARILPRLRSAAFAPVLEVLLRNLSLDRLLRAVFTVGKNTGFATKAFDACFLQAARSRGAVRALREVVSSFPESDATDRFLISSLQLSRDDLYWLYRGKGLNKSRASGIAAAVLNKSDDRALEEILADEEMSEELLYSLSQSPQVLGRLLTLGNYAPQKTLDLGLVTLPKLEVAQQRALSSRILRSLFGNVSEISNSTATSALEAVVDLVPVSEIVTLATSSPVESVSANLILFDNSSDFVKSRILQQIDKLVERVVHLRGPVPHVEAITALARLIADSGKYAAAAQERAAAAVVPYAFRHKDVQVSSLLVSAFPIVYGVLAKGYSPPSILDFFPFYDWDRCKVAREELVAAFMNSAWPPLDLYRTAREAGIMTEVLVYIPRRHRGTQYLKRLKADIRTIDPGRQPLTSDDDTDHDD